MLDKSTGIFVTEIVTKITCISWQFQQFWLPYTELPSVDRDHFGLVGFGDCFELRNGKRI